MAVTAHKALPAHGLIRAAIVAALVVGAVTSYLVVGDSSSVSSRLAGNLGIFVAFVFATVCCIRAARHPSLARRGWIAISVATGLSTLMGVIFILGVLSNAKPSPPPPAVDVIFVLGYAVPLVAAMLLFPRVPQPRISRYRTLLDAAVITTGVTVVSHATVMHDVYDKADLSMVSGWTHMAFPIADVSICALALTLGMRQYPGNRVAWLFFGAGSLILAATHSAFLVLSPSRPDPGQLMGGPLAAGWMTAGALIGLSSLVPDDKSTKRPRDLGVLIQLLPYVPVLGAALVMFRKSALDDTVLVVGELILLGLVVARQVMIVYENVDLTRFLAEKVAARTAELAEVGSIVNSSSDAIVGISMKNVITAWNPAAERMWGHPAAAVIGKPPDFLTEEEFAGIRDLMGSASALSGNKVAELEFDWVRPDGVTLPVAVTISPILDGDAVKGISVFGQDITERRKGAAALESAKEEALESSRLKSEFLATMSHEIRTPMNGVIGLTSLLLTTELDDQQHQYAEGVRGAGEALLALINDILDFSKLEAGKVILDPSDFDVRRMIDELGALLAPTAFAKHLELIAYCRPDVPQVVHGDAGRIRQIVLNLASNAVKFTTEGEVALKVENVTVNDGVALLRFSVADTGIGIADGDRLRLFESFSQADASTTRRFGGTGLGLAISRRLVEAMGGEIAVTSEIGAGSTFWFEIALPVGSPVVGAERPVDPDILTGRRVLVVDDNATNRTILDAQLTSWKMQPDLVEDALAALRQLRLMAADGRPYDLAVLDMVMPDVDGLELARIISADPELTGLPMIMLTSSMQPEPTTLRSAGIRQWSTKPVRSSDLYNGLVRLLSPQDVDTVGAKRAVRPAGAQLHQAQGRVLVVEDNTLNQLVAEGILTRMGYEVHSVSNGAEALDALAAMSYSAILMDCHMPVMDGFTATGEIRRRELGGPRTPIIAMTAAALTEDRRRCLDAGMDDYVSKPIDVVMLQSLLDRWVDSPGEPDDADRTAERDDADRTAERDDADRTAEPATDRGLGAADAQPVLDRSQLAGLSELQAPDGTSMLASIVQAFIGRGSDQLVAMRQAAKMGNAEDLSALAHELKGASGTIGAGRVAALCRELELARHIGTRAVQEGLLDELEVELADAAEQLTEFVFVHS